MHNISVLVVSLLLFSSVLHDARAELVPAVADSGTSGSAPMNDDGSLEPDGLSTDESAGRGAVVERAEGELIIEDESDVLILDDEEESLLGGGPVVEESAPQPPAPVGAVSAQLSGEEEGAQPGEPSPSPSDDAEGERAEPIAGESPAGQKVKIPPVAEPQTPAAIEAVRSINFAKGLKEYRSPKLAMLLSFAVPGLGQAYAKSYWRTAVYGAVELAVVGVSINYAVKGRDKKQEAWDFADKHYNVEDFVRYYRAFSQHTAQSPTLDDVKSHDEWMKNLFYGYDTTEMRRDAHNDQSFYSQIALDQYVYGWDDAEPGYSEAPENLFVVEDGKISGTYYDYQVYNKDTTWLLSVRDKRTGAPVKGLESVYGYSSNQQHYNDILHESNRLYKVSTNVLFVLLANHLVSAVDAFIAARAHNERLLGRQSIWEHISLDQRLAFEPGGVGTALGVRVTF